MNIQERIREQSGKNWWPLPRPPRSEKGKEKFLRFDCPFCHEKGKKPGSAAVNYARQTFECYRCKKTIGVPARGNLRDNEFLIQYLDLYRPQINAAITKIILKFGKWLKGGDEGYDDLYWKAAEFMWGYVLRPYGGPNDQGMYDEWESALNGNPDRLKAYIYKALYGDLQNYCDSKVRWKKRQGMTNVPGWLDQLYKDQGISVVELASPKAESYERESQLDRAAGHGPYDRKHTKGHAAEADKDDDLGTDDKTLAPNSVLISMAEDEQVPFKSWGMIGCPVVRNGGQPVRGHCAYCDADLEDRDPWEIIKSKPIDGPLATGAYLAEVIQAPVKDEDGGKDWDADLTKIGSGSIEFQKLRTYADLRINLSRSTTCKHGVKVDIPLCRVVPSERGEQPELVSQRAENKRRETTLCPDATAPIT